MASKSRAMGGPGCSTIHGNTFRKIAKPLGTRFAYVEFHDGSIYQISPVSDQDVRNHSTRPAQPGCWFNFLQRHVPGYRYRKLATFPDVPPSGWLVVFL